jgi:predicted dehydrogenase
MALIDFPGDVLVQWTWQGSAPGQGFDKKVMYGSEGCVDWESGAWTRAGKNTNTETLVKEYVRSLKKDEREKLFPGGLENSISVELKDFADAVRGDGTPEVDGLDGYRSQAICMAIFESSWFNRSVSIAEIERGDLTGYQEQIDRALGIV